MDAISRNTASVAQDFHKAGGVHELKIPANHQLLFNNKLPSQWTTREAAALLHSLSNAAATQNINFAYPHQQQQQSERFKTKLENGVYLYNGLGGVANSLRTRQHSTGEDDENTPSSASSTTSSDGDVVSVASPMKRRQHVAANEQRRAMTAFLSKNFDLQESYNNNNNNSSSNKRYQQQQQFDNVDQTIKEKENEDQENQVQLIRSPPAYNNFKYNSGLPTTTTLRTKQKQQQQQQISSRNHRPELFKDQRRQRDKENQENQENQHQQQGQQQHQHHHYNNSYQQQQQQQAAAFLTQMEYQNFNKIGTQFQNYVKDIINKFYAETPLLFPAMPTATTTPHQATSQNHNEISTKKRRLMSETEEYIEYLKNKEDITLTITPKQPPTNKTTLANGTARVPTKTIPDTNIALSITAAATTSAAKQQPSSEHSNKLETPSTYLNQAPQQRQNITPIATNTAHDTKPNRKSLSQLATLLPLLADAASQQQYLAAPLDFSKKATAPTTVQPTETSATTMSLLNEQQQQHVDQTELQSHTLSNNTATNDFVLNLSCSNSNSNSNSSFSSAFDKRNSRKQAQPKKIRTPPELVLTMLRDKYLNRLTGHKLSCAICSKQRHRHMLVFNYHSKGSLALHRFWKHRLQAQNCAHCDLTFKQSYSLKIHCRLVHRNRNRKRRGSRSRQQRKN